MLVTFIRILIGILFVVSSISKAIEIENFSFLLMSYGSKNLLFFAPVIIGLEFFSKDFYPQFPIYPVNDSIIAKLTKTYPLLINSKNGIIQKVNNGL